MAESNKSTGLHGHGRAIATAVSAVLAGPHAAQAQQQQQPRQQALEEIIVTATKREANLQEVPQSITAFTTSDIERRGFKDLDDYAAFIPSLSFSRREPGGTSIVFRGVASSGLQFGGDSSSALYLDEQPISTGNDNPDPRLIDIERLEALSGPIGTLYGASSQSGTLRIITNKPDVVDFDGWIDLSGSAVQDGDAGYDVSGMVNLPLVENKLALRLVGFYAEEAGFIDNVLSSSLGGTFDNSNVVEEDVNTVEITGGRAALRWNVNDNWTADFTALFQDENVNGFSDVSLNEGGLQGVGELEQVRFEKESLDDEWFQTAVTLSGDTGFADTLLSLAYFERDFFYIGDATAYEFQFNQFAINYGYLSYDFGGDPRGFATDLREAERFTIEARLTSPAGSDSRWQWLAGLFYNDQKDHAEFDSFVRGYTNTPAFAYFNYLQYYYTGNLLPPTRTWFLGRYDTTLEEFAVFGEVSFDVTENFEITAGGRWFQFDRRFALHQEAPANFVGFTFLDEVAESDGDDFIGKLNLTYKFSGGNIIYFTWSEGFRNGGSNPLRAVSVLPRGYEPDLLTNYEVGAKTEWLDGRLRFNITAYTMIWEDIQIQVEDPQPAIFALGFVNFPEAEITGMETEVSFLASENLSLTATLSRIDAETSKSVTQFGRRVEEGARLPLSPEWKGTFSIDYGFPVRWGAVQPYVRFDYSYVGESVNSLAGVESTVFGRRSNVLEEYQIGDLKLGLDGERWSGSLFVDNVWDERAEQFINNRWGLPRLSINRPRTYGVQLRYRFQ